MARRADAHTELCVNQKTEQNVPAATELTLWNYRNALVWLRATSVGSISCLLYLGAPSGGVISSTPPRKLVMWPPVPHGHTHTPLVSRVTPALLPVHTCIPPRSAAFLTFTTDKDAVQCANKMNGHTMLNKKITACPSHPCPPHYWSRSRPTRRPACCQAVAEPVMEPDGSGQPCANAGPPFHSSPAPWSCSG